MILSVSLAAALAAADDNYLIGLSNKGTLNRAKKDLAALQDPVITPEGEDVRVQMGEITCVLKAPLGESTCSCPSSAMCRHRIAAMLLLRDYAPQAEPPKPEFTQLRAYPADKLVKVLGTKRLAAALFRHECDDGPRIEESSVITVEMPWHPATVRLLEPLEHSTCTCHSKIFCVHKAEALLYWLLREKILDPVALRPATVESKLDCEVVKGICRSVREMLTAQLTTGLSRMPETVCETVERMAALSHTAGLADLERALRGLHGEYAAYVARSASFRETALLERLSHAFRLATALEQAEEAKLTQLAGTFRDDYESVGDLRLYLLGMRGFNGRGGYAGTIYYFWDTDGAKFMTFTHVRPTFYEESAKRRSSAPAPWGLPCTLQQAWNCAMELKGAKASRAGNLSSTEQCRATLMDRKNPGAVLPETMITTDFRQLLPRSQPGKPELERLALIRPKRCVSVPYDRVRQVFSIQLLDDNGRDLWLEVHFRKEESAVVDALERLAARLKRERRLRPVFFGAVYRDGDQLKFYPIEYFTEWEGIP